ncbi:MAG: sodium:calcium antiporter [Micavibrio sp.]|nr:sodium:calcium antiporter [Micavibrio sp.]|tara:strand:- start:1398 stop:2351 length:954 start_codon:yes stop_codon:yes gene_type:complete
MLITLFIISGLVLLFLGGDILVGGAVNIAKHFGMSELLIGIVLVGFGTSTPELITSVLATFEDQPGIAVGNIVGSNIANICLILGVSALIYPIACDKKTLLRDGGFMGAASLLLLAACFTGSMTIWSGLLFIALIGGYIGYCIVTEMRAVKAGEHGLLEEESPINRAEFIKHSGQFAIGLAMTFIGAHLLVTGAIDLARVAGISETIIGLTIVAIGTSMPELVASAMAAMKKNTGIAFGNIIGSNIYNILGVLGITAIMQPFVIPAQIISFDIWVMLGATALLFVFAATGWRISRWKGAVFLAGYGLYSLMLYMMTV